MKMNYDGALVMPSNSIVMDREEMTYVEGGIFTKPINDNSGIMYIYLSHKECKSLANGALGITLLERVVSTSAAKAVLTLGALLLNQFDNGKGVRLRVSNFPLLPIDQIKAR